MEKLKQYILIFVVLGLVIGIYANGPQLAKIGINLLVSLKKIPLLFTQPQNKPSPTPVQEKTKISINEFSLIPNKLNLGKNGNSLKINLKVKNNSETELLANGKIEILDRNGAPQFLLYSIKPINPNETISFFNESNAIIRGSDSRLEKIVSGKYIVRAAITANGDTETADQIIAIKAGHSRLSDAWAIIFSSLLTLLILYLFYRFFVYYTKL